MRSNRERFGKYREGAIADRSQVPHGVNAALSGIYPCLTMSGQLEEPCLLGPFDRNAIAQMPGDAEIGGMAPVENGGLERGG